MQNDDSASTSLHEINRNNIMSFDLSVENGKKTNAEKKYGWKTNEIVQKSDIRFCNNLITQQICAFQY